MRTALVFCGGGRSSVPIVVPDQALVVAADVGAVEARRLGFAVELLVGDMDSVPSRLIDEVEEAGGRVQRHPRDKDATDLDLALTATLEHDVDHVLIVGGDGGRLDQLLGNVLTMSAPRFASMQVDAIFGRAQAHVVRGHRDLQGTPGEVLSLFAVGGPALGVRTAGLRWPLDRSDLTPGSSLGISNEFTRSEVRVSVDEGVLLAIRPGEPVHEGEEP